MLTVFSVDVQVMVYLFTATDYNVKVAKML